MWLKYFGVFRKHVVLSPVLVTWNFYCNDLLRKYFPDKTDGLLQIFAVYFIVNFIACKWFFFISRNKNIELWNISLRATGDPPLPICRHFDPYIFGKVYKCTFRIWVFAIKKCHEANFGAKKGQKCDIWPLFLFPLYFRY